MASSSNRKTVKASAVKRLTPRTASSASKVSTPATPDSVAIADRIGSFQYKARYSKSVLSKYERLTRGD